MTTQNHPSPALKLTEQADLARSQRKLNVALVWLNTAAILEKADDTSNLASALNARLLGVIFDAATYSEDLALKCGNFTHTHVEWLEAQQEATALLLSRLRSSNIDSVDTDVAALALISGHLENLHKRFIKNGPDSLRLPTPLAHLSNFVTVMQNIRQQVTALAPQGICGARSVSTQLFTLDCLLGSADGQIFSFFLRWLSDWEAATFCIDQAMRYANDLPLAEPKIVGKEAQVEDLCSTLAALKTSLAARNYQASRAGLAAARQRVKEVSGLSRSF